MSYTAVDRGWAEWIAWQLEDAGYSVLVQAWDMVPGSNWLRMMHEATMRCERTIVVLSTAYLTDSAFGQAEWLASYRNDPSGVAGRLIPIRVEDCAVDGLLAGIVRADLFGTPDDAATRAELLSAVRAAVARRIKPLAEPPFPGAAGPADRADSGPLTAEFRVLVIGDFNRGKTTLINALLGQKVLPSFAVETTSTVCEVLVDTPGFGIAAYVQHIAENLPSADALVFVLNSQNAWMRSEVDVLRGLPPDVHPFFVFNKIDLIDPDQQDRLRESLISRLAEMRPDGEHRLYFVDAKRALATADDSREFDRSGLGKLVRDLRQSWTTERADVK